MSEGSLNIILNVVVFGFVLVEVFKSLFEGLRDLMNVGFIGLGDLIVLYFVDEELDDGNDDGDLNGFKDDDELFIDGEFFVKKSWLVELGNNRNFLIFKLIKIL